ncbi:MAG: peptidylprolyl isomerase [Chitinophagia bacterium]|nr:peptidylprolyl isomerase [Chitinophagia bacterium]
MLFINKIFVSTTLLFSVYNSNGQATKKIVAKPVASKPKITVKAKPTQTLATPKIEGTRIKITTDSGTIVVRLYDKTPLHRDNFIKLVNSHFYDSLLFHRIIAGFMIQGGDPESKNAVPDQMLGKGDIGYTIPAEFDSTLFHKKGALAAARTNNPEKASSGCQFYLVQGKKMTEQELSTIENQTGIYFSPTKKKAYTQLGGTPMLDMNYTVFGEVETGIEVIDRIAGSQKNGMNRPNTDIRMKMELIK